MGKIAAGGRARIAVTLALWLRLRPSAPASRLAALSSNSDLCLVAPLPLSPLLSSSVFLISLEKLFVAVKPPLHFVQRC